MTFDSAVDGTEDVGLYELSDRKGGARLEAGIFRGPRAPSCRLQAACPGESI
jgi:hypothetical protein